MKKIYEKIVNIIDFQCGIYYAFCYIINTFTNLIILFYFWSTPNKTNLTLLFITLSHVHLIICVLIRLISFLPYRPLFKVFSLLAKNYGRLFSPSFDEVVFHAISKCPSIEKWLGMFVMKVMIFSFLCSLRSKSFLSPRCQC